MAALVYCGKKKKFHAVLLHAKMAFSLFVWLFWTELVRSNEFMMQSVYFPGSWTESVISSNFMDGKCSFPPSLWTNVYLTSVNLASELLNKV